MQRRFCSFVGMPAAQNADTCCCVCVAAAKGDVCLRDHWCSVELHSRHVSRHTPNPMPCTEV